VLVVSRQSRESVVIEGADGFHRLLKVTVLKIDGPTVKLGIEVDPGVSVQRAEVREGGRKDPREGVADYALT
jgi:sRNA-binding carbon storage regulator CsrA